ncbi:MAG: PIG-L family deacetylase, partial [Agriterribacter sp.]
TFLRKDDPVLNWPNKITAKDFENWIQERGIYFAEQPGAPYRGIFAMNDAGEEPATGSLIVCDYGKGRFIYTGLVFFRQLPAGVGGAYRLFANLVANPNYKKTNGTAKQK